MGWKQTALHRVASCRFTNLIPGCSIDKSEITTIDLGVEMVGLLLAAGMNINAADHAANMALHKPASAAMWDVVV